MSGPVAMMSWGLRWPCMGLYTLTSQQRLSGKPKFVCDPFPFFNNPRILTMHLPYGWSQQCELIWRCREQIRTETDDTYLAKESIEVRNTQSCNQLSAEVTSLHIMWIMFISTYLHRIKPIPGITLLRMCINWKNGQLVEKKTNEERNTLDLVGIEPPSLCSQALCIHHSWPARRNYRCCYHNYRSLPTFTKAVILCSMY